MSHLDNLPFDRETAIRIFEHVDNIVHWAHERNIVNGSTPQAQFVKLVEEASELAHSEELVDLTDGLGDSLVVSIILCAQMGVNVTPLLFDASREDVPGYHGHFDSRPYIHLDAAHDSSILEALGKVASTIARKNTDGFSEAIYVFMKACVVHYMDATYSLSEDVTDDASSVEAALSHAWEEIKDRKGVMLDGVFIKSTDARYTNAVLEASRNL